MAQQLQTPVPPVSTLCDQYHRMIDHFRESYHSELEDEQGFQMQLSEVDVQFCHLCIVVFDCLPSERRAILLGDTNSHLLGKQIEKLRRKERKFKWNHAYCSLIFSKPDNSLRPWVIPVLLDEDGSQRAIANAFTSYQKKQEMQSSFNSAITNWIYPQIQIATGTSQRSGLRNAKLITLAR
jgi:hypothetical protein